MTSTRRLLAAILVGFAVVTLVNIAWEIQLPDQAEALLARDDGELRTLVSTEAVPARERYWITASLHEVASGGTLIVPEKGLVDTYHYLNFTEMDLRVEGYDSQLTGPEAAAIAGFPNIEGLGMLHPTLQPAQPHHPFVVAWLDDEGPAPTMRVLYRGDTVYLVDDRIMEKVRP